MSAPLLIVGTGMAALQLARQVRARDARRPIELISADSGCEYAKPLLSTAFAKATPPPRLIQHTALELADTLNALVRTRTSVSALDPARHEVMIGTERRRYGALVLALGAAPRSPFEAALALQPALAARVFSVNDLDDYRAFHAALEGRRRVLIVGSGLVGCEYANDLVAGGYRVEVVSPDPAPLTRLLPLELGAVLRERLHAAGVRWQLGRHVTALEALDAGVAATLSDGARLEADVVLVATGLAPRTALAEAAGLATSARGIEVDRWLKTSAPDVYALGDCAAVAGHNLMYVQPLHAAAKALGATLTGQAQAVRLEAWPILVKTPACPIVALPPRRADVHWHISGEGDDLAALAEDEAGRLEGFALTGRCVRQKVALARRVAPLLG